MKKNHLFNLFHIADSAFPLGSFAYSYGLESMAKHGRLNEVNDLSELLICYHDQINHFDAHFIASLLRESEFEAAIKCYHLQNRIPCIRKASETQGRSWIRLMEHTHPETKSREIASKIKATGYAPYYIVCYALGMKNMGYDISESIELYTYGLLRDIISAAIRIGLVGPTIGHSLLKQHFDKISVELNYELLHYQKAVRTLGVLEVAQLGHTDLYSKQFQN